MKKLVALTVALFISACTPTVVARAESSTKYSRITSESVVLYIDAGLTIPWFTLPYSYYVKVLSVSGSAAKVEYKGESATRPSAKGYISTEYLDITEGVPSVISPSLVLTVNQNCLSYKDVDLTIAETVTQNSTLDFYGFYTRSDGEKFVYGYLSTSYGDKFVGYIPESAVYAFSVPSLPMDAPVSAPSEDVESSSQEEQTNRVFGGGLQIIIVVAVSVVAVSIVYLLFRPSPDKVKNEIVSDCDFDDE